MANDKGQDGPNPNGPARARWLIWSRENGAFRSPPSANPRYTTSVDEAGRFSTAGAIGAITGAQRPVGGAGHPPPLPAHQAELLVLAPECAPIAVLLESLTENTQLALTAFLATTHAGEPGAPALNSHGALDLAKLVAMLLEDVALMIQRPGSWEGANMMQVMASHGYDAHQAER